MGAPADETSEIFPQVARKPKNIMPWSEQQQIVAPRIYGVNVWEISRQPMRQPAREKSIHHARERRSTGETPMLSQPSREHLAKAINVSLERGEHRSAPATLN